MNFEDLNDFGFTSFAETKEVDYKERLDKMYDLITPLISQLMHKAEDNPNIHWPNRKEILTKFMKELNKLKEE